MTRMLDLRLVGRLPRTAATLAIPAAPRAADTEADESDSDVDDSQADDSWGSDGELRENGPVSHALDGSPKNRQFDVGELDVEVLVGCPPGVDPLELTAFIEQTEHSGRAGSTQVWTRPLQRISRLLVVGVGDGDEAGWRAAGAALARGCRAQRALVVMLPPGCAGHVVRGVAEGLWLGMYRYRLGADDDAPALRRVTLVASTPDDDHATTGSHPTGSHPGSSTAATTALDEPTTAVDELTAALGLARTTAEHTMLARDLTNAPSDRKTPAWFARQVTRAAAGKRNLTVTVRGPAELHAEGFGGVLAVGAGSTRDPRMVEVSWRPRGARRHVVLVGKGITFDTGGICVKPRDGMKLMRKDMGGAAAVVAATLGAAALNLPVRVTALAPLAENMLSGAAMRPGDVVRHYGGLTTEVLNTDAEGRLVLADALAYAARRLRPDAVVDLATLTGAQNVALGKRTAALFAENDILAGQLTEAAAEAGEKMWRMPLAEDYVSALRGEHTDLVNSTEIGAGCVLAALYLREFTGTCQSRWAHIDMSAPAWCDSADGELVRGATGWGVRTLLRWLETGTDGDAGTPS